MSIICKSSSNVFITSESMVGQSASDTGVSRRDTEEVLFRHNINKFCRSIVEEREAKGVEELAYYYYPPDVFPNSQIPTHIFETLKKGSSVFVLYFISANKFFLTFLVH